MNCLQASPQPRRALDGVRRRVGGNSNGSVRRPLAGDAERRAAMSSFNGFAVLQLDPRISLRSWAHLERMRGGPEDAYAAFDFFVTADHIVDWLLPDWPDSSQPAGLARENIM